MTTPEREVPGEPVVDPTRDRAVYLQIADWLHDRIDNGAFGPGDALPSESKLMRQFGTARTTVRRALGTLAHEGLVWSQRGRGVFVRDREPNDAVVRNPYERLRRHHRESGRSSLLVDAQSQGVEVVQELLALVEEPATSLVAHNLGLEEGQTVLARRRRMWFGEQPNQLDASYLPLEIAQGPLRDERPGEGGTHARIEELGHRFTRFTEEFSLRMPTPDEVHMLRLGDGVPVVDLVQIAYAVPADGNRARREDERPVECFIAVLAGDKHRLEYRIDAE